MLTRDTSSQPPDVNDVLTCLGVRSSWRCGVHKYRATAHATAGATAFALFLGYLQGARDDHHLTLAEKQVARDKKEP